MTVNSSALQAVEWCNPSTSCYGFCRSIAIIASGDGRQRSGQRCACVCARACVCVFLPQVTILPFNTNPDKIEPNVYGNMSCFNTIVGPATPYNIRQLKWLVQELNAGGMSI